MNICDQSESNIVIDNNKNTYSTKNAADMCFSAENESFYINYRMLQGCVGDIYQNNLILTNRKV